MHTIRACLLSCRGVRFTHYIYRHIHVCVCVCAYSMLFVTILPRIRSWFILSRLVFLFLVFAYSVGHVLLCLLPVFHALLLSLVPLFTPLSLLPGVCCCSLPTCVLFSHLVLCIYLNGSLVLSVNVRVCVYAVSMHTSCSCFQSTLSTK